MHDIRKPYIRSNSNQNLRSRVEQFESRSYEREGYEERNPQSERQDGPVQIPFKKARRNVNDMDMYPHRRMDDIREASEDQDLYEEENASQRPRARRPKGESSVGTWLFIILICLLAIAAGLLTYVFNTATVTIVPKFTDINDFKKEVTFTQKSLVTSGVPFIIATSSSVKTKILPLSESKKVESKASGVVTILNNYDASPQKLIKNTRLESAAGKIYRINQSVTVPGKKGSTPGSVDVTIYADSNGVAYNSQATTFSIPGFKGTPREKGFSARSKGALTGGSSGNVSLASLSDMNAAKDELALELAQEVKANLMQIKKEGYIGLYGASEVTYTDNEAAILKGLTGTYEVTATGYVVLADASKLAQTMALGIRDYKNEPVRLGYTDTLLYTRKNTDHIASSSEMTILVEGKPQVIWVTDFDAIKEMVRGKKRDDFKPLMKSLSTIQGAEISFSPLWLASFPSDMTKISIVESFPKR